MRITLALLLILLPPLAQAQQRSEQFPLIGLWHSVSAVTRDGRDITPKDGGMELQFLPDNTVIETVSVSTKSDDQPVRTQYTYTCEAPDILSYTFHRGGRINSQHQRFRVTGDTVTFENLDSGMLTTMRRIRSRSLKRPRTYRSFPNEV